jgi:flagellar biosynthesis regulator FlbT
MSQFKAMANAHMRRDMEAGGKWACQCQACQEIRSLVGMDKTFEVRNLVRELTEIEARLDGLPDGPAKRSLMEGYLRVYDRLADKMAQDTATGER